MTIYRELDVLPERRTQLVFKIKREHITKLTILNLAMVQEIMSLCQISQKLCLILTLRQQSKYAISLKM